MHKCPYCPCVFETEKDLKKHLDTFGSDEKMHYSKWRSAHIEAEKQHRFF